MKYILKFFNFLFRRKTGVCFLILIDIFLVSHYRIDLPDAILFIFVGSICYLMSTLIGEGILYSYAGLFDNKKTRRLFLWLYFPFIIYELLRCILDLYNGYQKNSEYDVFVAWIYIFAFGYTLISILYFMGTSKTIKPRIKNRLETKKLIE